MKKCSWKRFSSFILAWNIKKWPLQREGRGCECPCVQVNAPFYVLKVSFYSWNCPFIFQNCPFFQGIPLLFSRNALFLQNCPLIFHKCLLYIYCARLFPRILFFGWFFFLLVVLIAPQTDNICFALVSFFLELFIDQLMMLAFCLCSHSTNNRLPVPGDLCVPNFLYVNSPWYIFRQGDHIFLKT